MTCRTEKENADLIKRLNRIEGQIRGIGKMIEKDRDCMDIVMSKTLTMKMRKRR